MARVSNTEKVNIYVPERTGTSLKRDAELFEIFRADGKEVNLNRFLSNLIVGYYNGYKQERNASVTEIKEIVSPYLRDHKKQDLVAEAIMERVILPEVPKRKGKSPVRLSLKPTLDTDQTITEIMTTIGPGEYVSQYLCRMLMSYCEKPTYEREKIIFRNRVDFLEEACHDHSEITFATPTNPGLIHHVIPWELVAGTDETFNYLLCQEYNDYHQRNEARAYRLCRINRPSYYHTSGTFEPKVIGYLERMKRLAPQHAINSDEEICVRLTAAGRVSFRMIYTGRPMPERTEECEEDGSVKLYFQCSQEQIYRYLLRFNAGEAIILYPEQLKKRIHDYYQAAMAAYE